jgi:hypothetical protein
MLAKEIRRQTVPFYLRWIPDGFLPHVNAAVSHAQSEGGDVDCPRYRHRTRSTWSFIMPFDLEHYIEDHSCNGEHKRY